MANSQRFPWLCSLPPSAILDQASPVTLDSLVEFENLIYARLFTEWARSAHPLTIDSISQLLSSRLLAQRPVEVTGMEWSDRKLRSKNRQLGELYQQFRDSSLAEIQLAMREDGGSGLRQEIGTAVAVRLAGQPAGAVHGSLSLAQQVITAASPTVAVEMALHYLSGLQDYGWSGAQPIALSPARSLLTKVWGLTEGMVRQALSSCLRAGPDTMPLQDDLLRLVDVLQSYGELAEQVLLTLPAMCNAAIDWLRGKEVEDELGLPWVAVRDARAELLASALLCTEVALRQVALGAFALAPVLPPLAATAVSATGISDLIAGLPSPMTHAGACYSRSQAQAMLGSQLLAAEYGRLRIGSHREELAEIARLLSELPGDESFYREHVGLVQRLLVLRRLPGAPGGSPGFTFAGQSAGARAARR